MNLNKALYVPMIMMLVLMLMLPGCKKNQTENLKETESVVHATEKKESVADGEKETTEATGVLSDTIDDVMKETQDLVVYDDEYIEIPFDPDNMETIPIGEGVIEIELSEYEKYLLMSGDEQAKYAESFESMDAFFDWYKAAKKDYEAGNNNIEINGNMIIDANN